MSLIFRNNKRHYALEVIILAFTESLISFMDAKMETPIPYGAFHLFFVFLSVFVGFLLTKYATHTHEKFIRRYLLYTSILVCILEVYKQINFSFDLIGDQIRFDYQWYAFPFQFCSTPMYIGLLAATVKTKQLHSRLCAYLASFSLFAGICVMIYPVTVFVDTIGINIQTMICHGSMITTGILLLRSGYVKAEVKTVIKAFPVFVFLVLCAIIMNEAAYHSGLLNHEVFNMFFISPYCPPELPVYSIVQEVLPYPFCIIVYIMGFTIASYVILCFAKLFHVTRTYSTHHNAKIPLCVRI